jgi:hypothetical protein
MDTPCETRPLSGSIPLLAPRRGAYTQADPIDPGQPPSTLGCGSGTPGRWMHPDEGCDLAARSPPPRVGGTSGFCVSQCSVSRSLHGGAGRRGLACAGAERGGFRRGSKSEGGKEEGRSTPGICATDDKCYAAGASRVGLQAGRGGSANATGMGARHGRAVWRGGQGDSRHGKSMHTLTHRDADADVVCLLLRRTDACAPFSCLLPPVRLSGSGRLHRANAAPAPTSSFLPPPRLYPRRPVAFTDTHAGRPLPSLCHPVRGMYVHVFIRGRIILTRLIRFSLRRGVRLI